jgi:hypothetical protein
VASARQVTAITISKRKGAIMGTKIIYMVLAGVFSFGWFYTGFTEHYATPEGGISAGWYFTTIIALALGAGESGDASNPLETIVNGLKSFIPAFIAIVVAALISRLIYEVGVNEEGFQVSGVLRTLSTVPAASVLTVVTMSCLKKAK